MKATHTYLHDNNGTKEIAYIQYLDFNNQYRWVLSQSLPCARFGYV